MVKQAVKQGLVQKAAQLLLDNEILAAKHEGDVRASQIAAAQALQVAQRAVEDGIARRVDGSNGPISDAGLQYLSVMGAVEIYRCAPETGLVDSVHRACQGPPKLEDVGVSFIDCSAGVIVASRAAASLGLKLEDGVLKAAGSFRKGSIILPEVYGRPVSGVVTTKPIPGLVRVFTTDLSIGAVVASTVRGSKIPGRKADRVGARLSLHCSILLAYTYYDLYSYTRAFPCPALFSRRSSVATLLLDTAWQRRTGKCGSDMHSQWVRKCVFHLRHFGWKLLSDCISESSIDTCILTTTRSRYWCAVSFIGQGELF